MRALGPSGTISRVKPVNRRWFQRLADIAIPWGVGLFYVLVVLGDEYDERVPTGIGLLLAVLALRRGHAGVGTHRDRVGTEGR